MAEQANKIGLYGAKREWGFAADHVIPMLCDVFGDGLENVQHIGATSLPKTAARPIIDIAVLLKAGRSAEEFAPDLEVKGFLLSGGEGWDNFYTYVDYVYGDKTFFHIYVFEEGSELWDQALVFRNYMKYNRARMEQFLSVKRHNFYSPRAYISVKRSFFAQILSRASEEFFVGCRGEFLPERVCGRIKGNIVTLGRCASEKVSFSAVEISGGDNSGRLRVCASAYCDSGRVVVFSRGNVYEPQIKQALALAGFMARRMRCVCEKSCGAVIYTVDRGVVMYLLVINRKGNIGFPKGHMEAGEDERMTAEREILEETGFRVKADTSFRRRILYTIMEKQAVYFTAEFPEGARPSVNSEISGFFLMDYEQARQTLTYEQEKRVLDFADAYIKAKLAKKSIV